MSVRYMYPNYSHKQLDFSHSHFVCNNNILLYRYITKQQNTQCNILHVVITMQVNEKEINNLMESPYLNYFGNDLL